MRLLLSLMGVNVTVGFADDNAPSPTHEYYCASAAKPGNCCIAIGVSQSHCLQQFSFGSYTRVYQFMIQDH